MTEYIEREKVYEMLNSLGGCGAEPDTWEDGWDKAIDTAIEELDKLPAADVQVTKHGEWVVEETADENEYNGDPAYIEAHCSQCGFCAYLEMGEYQWYYGKEFPWNYCPHCGAKMDGEDGEQNEKIDD